MPDWKMHVHTSEKLFDNLNIPYNSDFVFGSLLPDTPWMDSKDSCKEGTLKCSIHKYIKQVGHKAPIPNYYAFLSENEEFISETYIGKGMLFHLILDAVVNKNFNSVTQEIHPNEFYTKLARGTARYTLGFDTKLEEKYMDIHAYEDKLTVNQLTSLNMSSDVTDMLMRFGCGVSLDSIINKINIRISNIYFTYTEIFTVEQYDKMVDDAIEIFTSIGMVAGWKLFE